jgi:uncharacterized protein
MSQVPNPNTRDAALRVLIAGATGFIGTALVKALLASGHRVIALSRNATKAKAKLGVEAIRQASELTEPVDAVVNLSGANVFAMPWTANRKKLLLDSRVGVSDSVLARLKQLGAQPKVWVQASAVGFYATRSNHPLDEFSAPGQGFAAQLCQAVEQSSARAEALGMRVVNLRFGLVLGRSGGVFPMMKLGTKLAGGSVLGSGSQHVAWIHLHDALAMIQTALENPAWHGAVNAVAPQSPSYAEFAAALSQAAHRPRWLRVPEFVLKIALGERAPLMLEGAQIEPRAALKHGFVFGFPEVAGAMRDLVQ